MRRILSVAFLLACLMAFHMGIGVAEGSTVYFEDEFDLLDTSTWTVYKNDYPAPAVSASGGFLHLGQPGSSSLDFPVVYSAADPFPASGDFTIEIGFEYTSLAPKGDGFVVTDGTNAAAGIGFWADSYNPLYINYGTAVYRPSSYAGYHVVRYEVTGSDVTATLDGTVLGTSALPAGRPDSLFLGHPTVGQLYSTTCYKCDSDGVVTGRWWYDGTWTTLDVDYIRVTTPGMTTVPEPSTGLILGAGLIGLAWWRRKSKPKG